MRKPHLLAALAAWILSMSSLAVAQQAPTRPMPAARPAYAAPVVALLDVSYVFKNHVRFKQMMDEMKADVGRAEETVKGERTTLMRMEEKLNEFRPGNPDYKAMDEELTERKAKLAVQIASQKKEFLLREAKIYSTVYQEISQLVDYYAASNGIAMVLRFNGDPMDEQNPESVLAHINKPVIWYAQNLDITKVVLDQLNARSLSPNPAAPGNAMRPGVGIGINR